MTPPPDAPQLLSGGNLQMPPPVESKYDAVRYLHIHEGDELDEARLAEWVRQAGELPGAPLF